MTKHETKQLIEKLKQDLKEVEAERKFMQSQSGHHISRELRDKYKDEVFILRKQISELEESLS